MREIKFRAWDCIKKHWIIVELKKGVNFFPHITVDHLTNRNLSEWQQYTGLKDCKGKEIYEGDILQSPISKRAKWFVWWNEKEMQFQAKRNKRPDEVAFGKIEEYLVIGNIYENPELVRS